ncbi:FAD-dependent monooxygenase [Advenella alkanexedens]|uniref:FAD-dependent monooxygenase n=1 Tax=Advenella alkanexedens TaxID=1481665 RepID=A0ABS6NLT4_9BURK|nr:FAD-dependent monooxygenase [Advenella alkanexedens]MBV4396594.1 FAD-dependent monooxygenase [Advenella alkanexedens]
MSQEKLDCDVLVIGSGPTGSTLALALASYGIKVHVVSRWNWVANTPRAHITNQRTMEVFRELGIEEECYKYATPWDLMGDSLITTSLAGDELLRIRSWGTDLARKGDYLSGSPCELLDIPQPLIEPILVNQARNRGASYSFNTEYLSHQQDDAGITVQLKDRFTQHEYQLRAKFLVGADGANSKVMKDAGLALEGQLARAGTAYTLFEADLSQYTAHRPSILYWICSPQAAFGEIGFGLLRAIKPWNQWIAGWGFDINQGEPELSDEEVTEKIRILVGDPELKIKILNKSTWYVNQAYAPHYDKGRVFCAGDAVHRHPPSSGLGLNTCVQDAFNLAWKFAYVLKGHAGHELLDSFSLERAPVGKQIVARANQSRLDYAALQKIFRIEGEENPIEAGIANFRSPSQKGAKARLAAQQALQLKQTEFNAQGVEMNQRYESQAVINEPDPETWARDKELYLQATTRPGAKIPHAWLIDRKGYKKSTLDIVGKGYFTLLTGLSGHVWTEAAQQLELPFLRIITIGSLDYQDPYCEWQQRREINENGVLLIRPDGFVAWRQMDAGQLSVEQAKTHLERTFQQILSR